MKSSSLKCISCNNNSIYFGSFAEKKSNKNKKYKLYKCLRCGLYFFDRFHLDENIYVDEKLSTNKIKPRHLMIKGIISSKIKSGEILEIGAGDAHIINSLSELRYSFTIIDYQKPKKLPKNTNFIYSGINEIEANYFDKEKFNCIILDNVLEHLTDPMNTINKISKWLSKKGILVIAVPNRWNLKHLLSFDLYAEFSHPSEHINIFTLKSLNRIMKDNKLKIDITPIIPKDSFTLANSPSLLGLPLFGIYGIYKKI